MLRVDDLSVEFGGLRALAGVSLTVASGEVVSVIGANGAGKTTLFRAISGVVPLAGGTLRWDGQLLDGRRPHLRALLGIAHVPEGRRVFASMTVAENLELAAGRHAANSTLEEIYALFPILRERRRQSAGLLSGGEQQMLAIGRGLAIRPRLLMMDEPSMGLAPVVADQIFDCIRMIVARGGTSVLLVEQRATEAMEISDRTYVLETGRIVLSGASAELASDERVAEAYLGGARG
jgi:branched-chain amino acid transport system ATP-binding protein